MPLAGKRSYPSLPRLEVTMLNGVHSEPVQIVPKDIPTFLSTPAQIDCITQQTSAAPLSGNERKTNVDKYYKRKENTYKPVYHSWHSDSLEEVPIRLTEHVYISSSGPASDLNVLTTGKFTHVINMAKECPNYFEYDNSLNISYLHANIEDYAFEDALNFFPVGINFIENAISECRKNKTKPAKVLVHCNAGISRSGAMCTAYIMYKEGLRLDSALTHVKLRRSVVDPYNFMHQLGEFESRLEARGHYMYADSCKSKNQKFTPPPLSTRAAPVVAGEDEYDRMLGRSHDSYDAKAMKSCCTVM